MAQRLRSLQIARNAGHHLYRWHVLWCAGASLFYFERIAVGIQTMLNTLMTLLGRENETLASADAEFGEMLERTQAMFKDAKRGIWETSSTAEERQSIYRSIGESSNLAIGTSSRW